MSVERKPKFIERAVSKAAYEWAYFVPLIMTGANVIGMLDEAPLSQKLTRWIWTGFGFGVGTIIRFRVWSEALDRGYQVDPDRPINQN